MDRPRTPETDALWAAFRAAAGVPEQNYFVIAFGSDAATQTELAELVMTGRKRATTSLLRSFGPGGEAPPLIGGYAVTVDGEGRARCIWRTTELRLGRLDSVDERFAWDEGEGERTRAWWLGAHRSFFATQEGHPVDDGAETVFERFVVVWPMPDREQTA